MAWPEVESSGIFHIGFRFGDRKFKRSLRTTDQRKAEAARVRIEENIRLVERERLTLSSSANVATFLLSDGKLEAPVSVPKPVTIRNLFARYRGELPAGSLEPNSLATIEIHLNHLERLIGKSPPVVTDFNGCSAEIHRPAIAGKRATRSHDQSDDNPQGDDDLQFCLELGIDSGLCREPVSKSWPEVPQVN